MDRGKARGNKEEAEAIATKAVVTREVQVEARAEAEGRGKAGEVK